MTRISRKPGDFQSSLFDNDDAPYIPDIKIRGSITPTIIEHEYSPMTRPFISWDGEGYTDESTGRHHYWLLSNSLGDRIIAPPGRSIERVSVAQLMCATRVRYPHAINGGFALGYDFTQILGGSGLLSKQQQRLKDKSQLYDSGYLWKVMSAKQLTVAEHSGRKNDSPQFTLYDTWGFFQRSFVAALDEYFGEDWPGTTAEQRAFIIAMKANRQNFDRNHDDETIEYNDHELRLLVDLLTELRHRAFAAGAPLGAWYGPGAWASGLMKRHSIKRAQGDDIYETNKPLAEAAMGAYSGGRFECLRPGKVNGAVYQYDINSAYPYAIAQLPDLSMGWWDHQWEIDKARLSDYAIYRVDFRTGLDLISTTPEIAYPRGVPFPLWRRDPKGNISYPTTGIHGWYYGTEIKAALAWIESEFGISVGASLDILEGWVFQQTERRYPFSWVPEMYRQRQVLKRIGNGAHIAIKLMLNSLYGKLAQQIGYTEASGRKPPYHNLIMAGMVTAKCRSMMLLAALQNLESVIAFETDGIFTSQPLDLDVSTELGAWDETVWEDMYYFQSGFRFGIKDGIVVKPATRGIPAADISLDAIMDQVRDSESEVRVRQTRFYTLSWALHLNKPHMIGQWDTVDKRLRMMQEDPRGKRVHDPDCDSCVLNTASGIRSYRWDCTHRTIPAQGWEGQLNRPHDVMWMRSYGATSLSEVRLTEYDADSLGDEVLF